MHRLAARARRPRRPAACSALAAGPRRPPATDPVGVWPLRPEPEVVRGFDPPDSTRRAPATAASTCSATPGQPVRAALPGTVDLRRAARRPRRRGGRPRRHPDDLRAGRRRRSPSGDARRRRATALGTPASSPARTASPAPACTGAGSRGETYLDPLRLVGAGPVRLLPLWRRRARPVGTVRRTPGSAVAARAGSGPRVRLLVGPAQPVGGDVGVELGGRQRGVARAAPGPSAGRRRPRAGGWPRCAAARAGRCRGRPGTSAIRRCTSVRTARWSIRRRARPRNSAAPGPVDRAARAGRAAASGPAPRAAGRPNGTVRSLRPLPKHPDDVAVAVDVVDVEAARARRPGCRWRRAARASPRRAARPGCRRRRARRRRAIRSAASSARSTGGQRPVRLGRAEAAPTSVGVRPVRASQAVKTRAAVARRASVVRDRPMRLLLGQPAAQRAQVELADVGDARAGRRGRAARRCRRGRRATVCGVRSRSETRWRS